MPLTETLMEVDTELYADSVEWCPLERCRYFFVGATYQLHTAEKDGNSGSKRTGYLQLYEVKNSDSGFELQKHTRINTVGILDVKWCMQPNSNEQPIFACVDSTGRVNVYELIPDEINLKHTISAAHDSPCIALSLSWSSDIMATSQPCIASSYSTGELQVSQLTPTTLTKVNTWKAHDFEAWICAFNHYNPSIVYSGGDDCRFKGWDTRSNDCLFTNRTHEMGVCSMHCSLHRDNILATGSYDENIRLWDTRCIRKSPLSSSNVGGGVWRLKWSPHDKNLLVAACMHNGVSVIDCSDIETDSHSTVVKYSVHNSLSYGVDWCFESSQDNLLASCSFYDHKLCVWRMNLNTR